MKGQEQNHFDTEWEYIETDEGVVAMNGDCLIQANSQKEAERKVSEFVQELENMFLNQVKTA